MKVLMTNRALDRRGGSESYLVTVATELRRLGHEVVFFAPFPGAVGRRLAESGFEVHERPDALPADVDVIHGQHVDAVAAARTRLPRTPLVFVTHSWFVGALEDPVAGLGASALVALNDLTHRRLTAHTASAGVPVFRLTQPVTVSPEDGARVPVADVLRRVVALSRGMRKLPARLAAACEERGIVFDWVGGPGREVADPLLDVQAADVVVTMGRGAVEAMAAGRAVLVADENALGGWVSEASYPSLEADGFTGLTGKETATPEALLDDYSADLGTAARALAVRHHAAPLHAVRLVEIYRSVAGSHAEACDPAGIALLAQDRLALEARAVWAEWAAAEHLRERQLLLHELDVVRWENEELRARVQGLERP